jgi:hypothetical protein
MFIITKIIWSKCLLTALFDNGIVAPNMHALVLRNSNRTTTMTTNRDDRVGRWRVAAGA